MSARYETDGDAASVNPLIIIIRGVVGGYKPTRDAVVLVILVVFVVARAALRYYVTTLSKHTRAPDAMGRWEDGKPLALRTKGQSSFSGSFLPSLLSVLGGPASLGMHTKQYL